MLSLQSDAQARSIWNACTEAFPWMARLKLGNRIGNAYSSLYQFLGPATGVFAANLTLRLREYPQLACHDMLRAQNDSWAVVWSAVEHSLHSQFRTCRMLSQRAIVSIESQYEDAGIGDSYCPVLLSSPCSIAVPYPTHVHATSDEAMVAHLQHVAKSPRYWLASYGGGSHGQQIPLRDAIQRDCAEAEASSCHSIQRPPAMRVFGQDCQNASRHYAVWHEAYLHSDFCLMPPGDTVTRQGWFDALLAGCVPVFFASCVRPALAYETMYSPFLPRHERSRYGPGPWAVLLNASAVISSPGYLLEMLRSIPKSTIGGMRRTILQHLPGLQYSAAPLAMHRDAQTIFRQLAERIAVDAPTCCRNSRGQHVPGAACPTT